MYFFAYDDNLSKKVMAARCPEAKPVSPATLPNYKLVFSGWSRQWHGATAAIMSTRGERVRGAVYEISEADRRRLDRAMECPARRKPLPVTVFDPDDSSLTAFTYLPAGPLSAATPGAAYLEVLRQGLKDWGLR